MTEILPLAYSQSVFRHFNFKQIEIPQVKCNDECITTKVVKRNWNIFKIQ